MSEAETLVSSPTRTVRLLDRHPIAEQTLAFELERPPGFDFKAGQFAEITWIDPPETDDRGNSRAFSITSAPEDRRLTFATRLRDTAFKRILSTAPLGARARVAGPFGNFALSNHATRPAVLLAGGIGITPFRSMARHLAHERRTRPVLLFYANRRREDAPFLEELWALKNEDPGFTFVPTITGPGIPRPRWRGETGRITLGMMMRHLPAGMPTELARGPVYHLAGPPGMVRGLTEMLHRAGVVDGDIRTEEFSGY